LTDVLAFVAASRSTGSAGGDFIRVYARRIAQNTGNVKSQNASAGSPAAASCARRPSTV